MMADGAISVRSAVSFSWSLWTANWRAIWGVLALNSLAGTVAMAGSLANNPALLQVGALAAAIFALMSDGAVFRLALSDRHIGDPEFAPGVSGLQWRQTEWRLLGASLLLAAFVIIVGLLLLIAVGAVVVGLLNNGGVTTIPKSPEAINKALGPAGQQIVQGLVLVSLGTMIFVVTRLRLATACTVDAGKIQVLSTWRITKGHFWRIFGTLVLIIGPSFLVSVLLLAGTTFGTGTTPVQMTPSAALLSGLILGVLSGAMTQPLIAGVMAYYCRQLRTTASGGTT